MKRVKTKSILRKELCDAERPFVCTVAHMTESTTLDPGNRRISTKEGGYNGCANMPYPTNHSALDSMLSGIYFFIALRLKIIETDQIAR